MTRDWNQRRGGKGHVFRESAIPPVSDARAVNAAVFASRTATDTPAARSGQQANYAVARLQRAHIIGNRHHSAGDFVT
jgi:hypothetical protein